MASNSIDDSDIDQIMADSYNTPDGAAWCCDDTAVVQHDSGDVSCISTTGTVLNEPCQQFLKSLVKLTLDRDVTKLSLFYEKDFNELADKYYSTCRLPSPGDVSDFLEDADMYHSILVCLYTELYSRHLFNKCQSQVEPKDRVNSWSNYSSLLEYIIEEECSALPENAAASLQLPMEWAWDFLDEFVYQFQEAQQWRVRLARSEPRNPELYKHNNIWKTSAVLNFLIALIEESRVYEIVTDFPDLHSSTSSDDVLLKYKLGYFAMICLLSLNVSIGDFNGALTSVDLIDINTPNAYFWKIAPCAISLFYNIGIAYIMTRRYRDAIRVYSQILSYVSKKRSYISTQSYQRSVMLKTMEKISNLVVLCSVFSDGNDPLLINLKDDFPPKHSKIALDNEDIIRDVFHSSCPKFINPVELSHNDTVNDEVDELLKEDYKLRYFDIFLKGVRREKDARALCSFVKLYNNISFKKLSSLMYNNKENDTEDMRAKVLAVKALTLDKIWQTGPPSGGVRTIQTPTLGIDFHVENNCIYVQNCSAKRGYVDYFLREIARVQEMRNQLKSPTLSSPPIPPELQTTAGRAIYR